MNLCPRNPLFAKLTLCGCRFAIVLTIVAPATGFAQNDAPSIDPTLPQHTEISGYLPSNDVLVANGATVGEIIIRTGDVFDLSNPKENNALFRLANGVHIKTRDWVISYQLLFDSGDPYNPELLVESERNLRGSIYLYDAVIRPIRYHNNKVDIEVLTRDVWTLTISAGFSRKGGDTSYGFDIEEKNFIGMGKTVAVRRDVNEFRSETGLSYIDPAMGSKRFRMELGYSDNSDGDVKQFSFGRPFYSLHTRWSFNLLSSADERADHIFESGVEVNQYQHISELHDINAGFSKGLINNVTRRWRLGFAINNNLYAALPESKLPQDIPEDRKLAYPWVGYQSIQNQYVKTTRVNQIKRTEDINLGNVFNINLGWSDQLFGANRDGLVLESNFRNGIRTYKDHLLQLDFGASGLFNTSYSENVLISGTGRYFYPMFGNQVFYSRLNADAGHNLDPDKQLLIGGESGLRGYPARVQSGNRRTLLTLEQRIYSDMHIVQLAYIGGAVFFDIGQAWTPGITPKTNAGWLKDVGFGLRITSSRSSRGSVLHIDVAFPLDGDNIDPVQLNVATEATF